MKAIFKQVTIVACATVLLLLIVEGAASVAHVSYRLWISRQRTPAERQYSQYDTELGWVPIANTHLSDFYGPGKHLSINSVGARSTKEFSKEVPRNKLRILFSGDSFTHGWGVGDDAVWNQLLALRDSRLETVNLGQGGYGIDQAYLWYLRMNPVLNHNVHVFAWVEDDFMRALRDHFMGYPKPVLRVGADGIAVTNTPVPRTARLRPWWTLNAHLLRDLRIIDSVLSLTEPQKHASLPHTAPGAGQTPDLNPMIRELTTQIFEDLKKRSQDHGVVFVLTYLPTLWDHPKDSGIPGLRQFIHAEASRLRIPLYDPVEEFRNLSTFDVRYLFISREESPRFGGAWHYNEKGNQYIAHSFYTWLLKQRDIQDRLDRLSY